MAFGLRRNIYVGLKIVLTIHCYQTTVKMEQVDAAGVLFFTESLKMFHYAYEAWLDSIGFGIATLLKDHSFLLPIVHAEADYFAPIQLGEVLTIELNLEHLGEHSFTLGGTFLKDRVKVMQTQTVHVAVARETKCTTLLPETFKTHLNTLGKGVKP